MPEDLKYPCGGDSSFWWGYSAWKLLLCDGSNVSRTTYARLFAVIGTAYGAGDGSGTFGLSDLRDRVPMGKGTNNSTSVQRLVRLQLLLLFRLVLLTLVQQIPELARQVQEPLETQVGLKLLRLTLELVQQALEILELAQQAQVPLVLALPAVLQLH